MYYPLCDWWDLAQFPDFAQNRVPPDKTFWPSLSGEGSRGRRWHFSTLPSCCIPHTVSKHHKARQPNKFCLYKLDYIRRAGGPEGAKGTTSHNTRFLLITRSVSWSLFAQQNDPPINSFSSWVCGFSGSFLVQKGSKRDILRKLPEGPSMSRAHIPFGKIGFWPDRHRQTQTDTDGHRTNKEIRALLYNSPFGAIIMDSII